MLNELSGFHIDARAKRGGAGVRGRPRICNVSLRTFTNDPG
jgi:hypothetical protein